MNKLICFVGMPGAGKTEIANYFLEKGNFGYFRFGQVVLDKVKETGQPPSEKLEREIREKIRQELGMAAIAILNEPIIEKLLERGHVLGDGLRSYEEYLYLKEKFPENLKVVQVFAPPSVRYERLMNRSSRHGEDKDLKYRSFTLKEAEARDRSEIEGLHIGGTVAMADYVVINNCSLGELYTQVDDAMKRVLEK